MADMFTRAELATYLQVPEVDNATADLLLSLVTEQIRQQVGALTFDAMSDNDKGSFKGIALEAVRRSYLNPSGLRSTTVGAYSETFATETIGGVFLTSVEKERIDWMTGKSSGAFSIRPYGQSD